ncbi:hypothetical protein J1614_001756 [Plenodomus biglobosus]|nr:hypothetical protein J1614_001756 [Plenodomus biglobosus]
MLVPENAFLPTPLPLRIHSLAWRSQVSPNLDDPDLLAIPINQPVLVSEIQRRLCWKNFHDLIMETKHRVFANEVETVLNMNDDIGRTRAETFGELISSTSVSSLKQWFRSLNRL